MAVDPSLTLAGLAGEDVVNVALVLAFLALLAAGVRAIIRAAEGEKRRVTRLAGLAEELDWSFSGQLTPVDVQSFKPFTWFIRGPELEFLIEASILEEKVGSRPRTIVQDGSRIVFVKLEPAVPVAGDGER